MRPSFCLIEHTLTVPSMFRFSTWVIVFGGGTGINAVGPKIFVWPLLCCFLAAAYVYFLCPETTGKTLEEIDALFARTPEVRARLEEETRKNRGKHGAANGPAGRRASLNSLASSDLAYGKPGTTTQTEKV